MSDQGASLGGLAGSAGDPLGTLVAGMCDAWMLALLAVRAVADPAGAALGPRPIAGAADPVSALFRAMTGFPSTMGDIASQAAAATGHDGAPVAAMGSQGQPAPSPAAAELPAFMARAAVVAASSAMNYWRSLAEAYARHQASFVQYAAECASGQTSDAERRLFADELRGFFREVSEAAMREARRLHAELAQIGEAVARVSEPPDPAAAHRRHWKAKE